MRLNLYLSLYFLNSSNSFKRKTRMPEEMDKDKWILGHLIGEINNYEADFLKNLQ